MVSGPTPIDPIPIALKVARALDACGIEYLVGGSFASTFHGEPRSTLDVDFALHLDPASCPALFAALSEDFFVDLDDLREAARDKSLVNVFHRDPVMKVHLHVRPQSGHHAEEIRRAALFRVAPDGELRIATPEDTVLRKLWWFREGLEASDRQWRDVLGVLKTSSVDRDHLRRWAVELGVADLVEKALREAGLEKL